ncbi:DNA methyltransferase [Spiroplasma sp. BIUS-1]|uniref:DNA methyltransferase n=1 Tax=Spiroplasma sp. BIUS-1 TaxID=216964 RepID=UPI0013A6E1AE|nr:DNA methyltransferase [Spiroplasma sp. BIUS-1]
MHRICSYVAMFPPTLANYFIENYSEENDVILDTFSGRGTTVLEARMLNRKAYAIDLNPFAYVLSKAKSNSFLLEEVLDELKKWEVQYNSYNFDIEIDDEMEIYYSRANLKQITFIKEFYGKNWRTLDEIQNFILAITLGLMHGPQRKSGDSMYFSLSMSNCISMSKNYVKNFANKKNLKRPEDNIFSKIENRIKNILKGSKYSKVQAKVLYGNSLEISNYIDVKPKLIFTSPPYLNIINYTQQNWIKMWLLGYDSKDKNNDLKLDDKHNIKNYIEFMKKYLISISKIMDKNSTLAMVIGDVQKVNEVYSFDKMWNENLRFYVKDIVLTEIYTDPINQNNKATNSMGNRAGKSTRIDKIYIFKKVIK